MTPRPPLFRPTGRARLMPSTPWLRCLYAPGHRVHDLTANRVPLHIRHAALWGGRYGLRHRVERLGEAQVQWLGLVLETTIPWRSR